MTGRHEEPRRSLREQIADLVHARAADGARLEPAQHTHRDGPSKGWAATDFDPATYSSDEYAAQFPEVTDGAE